MPRFLPDTGQRVRHAELLSFGIEAKNNRRLHPLDLAESCHLSQLQLEGKRNSTRKHQELENNQRHFTLPNTARLISKDIKMKEV